MIRGTAAALNFIVSDSIYFDYIEFEVFFKSCTVVALLFPGTHVSTPALLPGTLVDDCEDGEGEADVLTCRATQRTAAPVIFRRQI